jgi:hypothetical protein
MTHKTPSILLTGTMLLIATADNAALVSLSMLTAILLHGHQAISVNHFPHLSYTNGKSSQ